MTAALYARTVLAALVGLCVGLTVTMASAQTVRTPRPGRAAAVASRPVFVSPYLSPPPLPYQFYVEQALRKRQHAPRATQSFEGSSPRCPRFFCDDTARRPRP